LLKSRKISQEQHIFFFNRFNSLKEAYTHTFAIDVIEQVNDEVTFMCHFFGTHEGTINLGGKNLFDSLFLYEDETGKKFYTVPVTYVLTLKKGEYLNMIKNESKADIDPPI
jgi:hypothetical protein